MTACKTTTGCKTPKTFLRRKGAVWCCPTCGQLWTLVLVTDSTPLTIFDGDFKEWKPITYLP